MKMGTEEFVYEPEKCTEVIELDITDDEFLLIAKAAHKMDITFNHFVNLAVHEEMQRINAMTEEEKQEYANQARQLRPESNDAWVDVADPEFLKHKKVGQKLYERYVALAADWLSVQPVYTDPQTKEITNKHQMDTWLRNIEERAGIPESKRAHTREFILNTTSTKRKTLRADQMPNWWATKAFRDLIGPSITGTEK